MRRRLRPIAGFENAKRITVRPGQTVELDGDTIIEGDVPSDATVLTKGFRVYVTGTIQKASLVRSQP